MAGLRIHTVMPSELVVRVDGAASAAGVSRGEFVRRAVERALGGDVKRSLRSQDVATRSPAPAEQPPDTRAMDLLREDDPDPDFIARGRVPEFPASVSRVRSSASRPFRPAPKGKA